MGFLQARETMRAGLVIYGGLDTLSGGYLYDRKLVDYLRGRGDRVEIISLPRRPYLLCLKDNFSVPLLRRLAGLQVDVLLQDELNHPSLFLLNRRLKAKAGYRIVPIVHHLRCCEDRPEWQNMLYRRIERRYLSSADGFIFNSQTTRREVGSLLANDVPCVVAYPCGDRLGPAADISAIRQRMQDRTLRLLFIGNLIPRKGLHVLLKALRMLRDERWTLTVAGNLRADPSYARYIYREVARSGLEARVFFAGSPDDAGLANIMGSSHILVVPSSYEGYGIVYIEGMGFGLPSIGTTGGAACEVITDGRDGFLVPPGDARALADRLYEIMADRQRLFGMSMAALARYGSHPSWDRSMNTVRNFLVGLEGFKLGNS